MLNTSNKMIVSSLIYAEIFLMLQFICCNPTPDPATSFNAKEDANKIFTASDRNAALLEIFPARTFKQCYQINEEFTKLNGGVPLVGDVVQYNARDNRTIENDVYFAKIYGTELTKVVFLKACFEGPHKIGGMGIIQDILIIEDINRPRLISLYDKYREKKLIDCLNQYEEDYKHFLLELYHRVREEENDDPINPRDVEEAVKRLNKERKKRDSWDDNRKELDCVLMNKPIKFAVEVIKQYAASNHGNELRDDIRKKFEGIYEFIMEASYQSLVDFVSHPYTFLARLIHGSLDRYDNDRGTTPILLLVGNSENPQLPKINEAFRTEYGKPINEYLVEKDPKNFVYKILAAIVVNSLQTQPPPPSSP